MYMYSSILVAWDLELCFQLNGLSLQFFVQNVYFNFTSFCGKELTTDQLILILSFHEICICKSSLKKLFTRICFRDWGKEGQINIIKHSILFDSF